MSFLADSVSVVFWPPCILGVCIVTLGICLLYNRVVYENSLNKRKERTYRSFDEQFCEIVIFILCRF